MDSPRSALRLSFRRRALIVAAELGFFLGLAVYSTWPLVVDFRTALPQGTEPVATVPLFNLWTLWWNADRLAHGCAGYWNAPIFYPTPATFAFSEPQPVCCVAAPLVWLNQTPVPAYNAYLLLSLVLNGWTGTRLVRQVTGNLGTGLAGGAMLLMLPFVHWQLGVLQLVPLWGVLWAIAALRQFGQDPGIARGLSLGTALAATYLSCAYHGLFLILLLLAAGGWLLGKNLWNWRKLGTLFPGGLVCLALVYPVLSKQREIMQTFAFERPAEIITTLSAEIGDYSVTPWPQLLSWKGFAHPARRPNWQLGPGNIKFLLAAAGVMIGMIDPRLRRWTLFGITFTTIAVLLSMGLKLHIGGWIPYQLLIDWFPGMAQVRNVFRFALFAQLMTALLAAQGLEVFSPMRWRALWCRWRNRTDARGGGLEPGAQSVVDAERLDSAATNVRHPACRAGVCLTLVIGGLAALEVRSPPQKLFHLPQLEQNRGWIDWLRQETPRADVIACVPFPRGTTVEDYFDTTLWMYWETFHERRMVNGYSGFFPESFVNLKSKMQGFPDQESLHELESRGAAFCVIRRRDLDPDAWDRIVTTYPLRLKSVLSDEQAGMAVFELISTQRE